MFTKTTLKRFRFAAPLLLATLALSTTLSPAPAMAATSTYIGTGGGYVKPVQLYAVSFGMQGPYSGTGYWSVQANINAPANVSYNWTTELEEYVGGKWISLGYSPTYRASGNQIDLEGHFQITMNNNYPHYYRAFFWMQDPTSGNWYYAAAVTGWGSNLHTTLYR